jgi:hypothetical protein
MGVGRWWDIPLTREYPAHPALAEVVSPISRFRLAPKGFPAGSWSPDFRAMLTLAEFAGLQPDWRQTIQISPVPDDATTELEIQHLIELARTQRVARLPEIVEQYSGYPHYFVHLLAIAPDTRPATYLLLKIGARIGELVMTYFKEKFNRPRPSHYCPPLLPPVDFAGIPSYPGGHAVMGHLMALCVAEAVPEWLEVLQVLADRIAHNMEIGGFHFPSDTTSGREAAAGAIELLRKCNGFIQAVDAAKREW